MIAKMNSNPYSKYMQRGISSIQLVLVILLLIGLAVGIYLIGRPQTYKSNASTIGNGWVNALEITDSNGNRIVCDTTKNPVECITSTTTVNVKVTNPNLIIQ
jgi:hypothetical protein